MESTGARFVSRLTNNTMALVLAGGRGQRLGVLTDWRTKPAVPFGGKFRIIDFTLSNCCLLYTSPSPRDRSLSRMPSSA